MSFHQFSSSADAPALDAVAITPSASPLARVIRTLYVVGTAGTVTVTTWMGTSVTLTVASGAMIPIVCTHVTAATATGLIGLI